MHKSRRWLKRQEIKGDPIETSIRITIDLSKSQQYAKHLETLRYADQQSINLSRNPSLEKMHDLNADFGAATRHQFVITRSHETRVDPVRTKFGRFRGS